MTDSELTTDQKVVIGHVQTLARTFSILALFNCAILVSRLLGVGQIKQLGLEIPLSQAWWIFTVVTVIHIFFGGILVYNLGTLRDEDDDTKSGVKTFDAIRSSDSVLLRGVMPRNEPLAPRSRVYKMYWRDPTTWLYLGLGILSYTALLPWVFRDSNFQWTVGRSGVATLIGLGVVLLIVNWIVGGQWLVMLSQLGSGELADRWAIGGSSPVWHTSWAVACAAATLLLLIAVPIAVIVLL